MFAIAENRYGIKFDTHAVLPSGTLRIPIAQERRDVDFHEVDRPVVARNNTLMRNALPNFFGIPEFSAGTEDITDLYALPGVVIRTIRQPAPYFNEAVLVVGTNVPLPKDNQQLEQIANTIMPTVLTRDLDPDAQVAYTAHALGALWAAVDTANDVNTPGASAVAISHQAPLTSAEFAYPRSAPVTHTTVGIIRHEDLRPASSEHPRLAAERKILKPDVLIALADEMQHALTNLGVKPSEINVIPRRRKPAGIGIHIPELSQSNLISPEGVRDASVIFDRIALAQDEVYPEVFGHLPDEIKHKGKKHKVSRIPAHRQILYMHKGHLVYGYVPLIVSTHVGGSDASGLLLDRSIKYTSSVQQQQRIDAFNNNVSTVIHASTKRLGYDRYRRR